MRCSGMLISWKSHKSIRNNGFPFHNENARNEKVSLDTHRRDPAKRKPSFPLYIRTPTLIQSWSPRFCTYPSYQMIALLPSTHGPGDRMPDRDRLVFKTDPISARPLRSGRFENGIPLFFPFRRAAGADRAPRRHTGSIAAKSAHRRSRISTFFSMDRMGTYSKRPWAFSYPADRLGQGRPR